MNKLLFKILFVIGFVILMLIALGRNENNSEPSNFSKSTPSNALNIYSSASWVSNAKTIRQLVLEADLIVRARVLEKPLTRVIHYELPVWDEEGHIVGSATSQVLFSDTVFEVLETYAGDALSKIVVMQTGGFDPSISSGIEEMPDDPLYRPGEEYILFLVEISGDKVHAPDRELYRVVNPFGRYKVEGENVLSYGQSKDSVTLPTAIEELEAQIIQTVQEIKK